MRFLFFGRSRKKPEHGGGMEPLRSLFSKFRRIQKLNAEILEIMAEMERALGGEYIFDRAFLESSVNKLGSNTYQVIYSLNALSDNSYMRLFDRYQTIKSALDDILRGGLGQFATISTLPFSALGFEMEPLAGAAGVCLAEARNHLDISAPDGFVVTVTGCARVMEDDPGIEEEIAREVEALFIRRGGPAPLSIRPCAAGGYDSPETGIVEIENVSADSILYACKLALQRCAGEQAGGSDGGSFALAIYESTSAKIYGTVIPARRSPGLLRVTAAPAESPDQAERYWVRRVYPFQLVCSELLPKPAEKNPGFAGNALSVSGDFRRGSALLRPEFLKALAETVTAVERSLGRPCELSWARTDTGRPVIVNVRPAIRSQGMEPEDTLDALRNAEVILSRGETAQTGTSAGKVVHIKTDSDIESFPHGGVAVAKTASPRLSTVLRRAAAIITETGTSIGHLATIARELRVPAIFGAAGALDELPEGMEVTVDAGERSVYKGVIEQMLDSAAYGSDLFPEDPEYMTLRLLLRMIMPLNLLDPESKQFSAENCLTYHDIVHFAHERSVEELLNIHDRHPEFAGLSPRRLETRVPCEIFVIHIDEDPTPERGRPGLGAQTDSEPFSAFIRGFSLEQMWDRGPASFKLRDIFTGLDRTFSAMNTTGSGEKNLAVIASNYMNLSLRLGYHFSVIDSYMTDNVNQNYVYFRFVGGFADKERRRRRSELIRIILEDLHFKVTVKGDLVVGKFKIARKAETAAVLTRLGELTGFTRQLDTAMASDATVEEYAKLFFDKSAMIHRGGAEKNPDD